ncbi:MULTISPECIES: hypothetical protein [Paenibacillus]|uniref:hypothetical protein n=1 Tax=Paenibacillus TaxID=44249 RepID=UPI001B29BD86|nr:hypothetical protein [Paenibacillus sp. J53TS2]GIP48772.1 hypothetical protein J53TS2_23630 [Paenibacillus sp. J53TS2]
MTWFEATGTITYFETWAIAECPKDIMNYYGHWVYRTHHMKLNKPKFGSHISIIRGEDVDPERKIRFWGKYAHQPLTFAYSNEMGHNAEHYWLPVCSREMERLRTELGLPKDPPFGFHLTLGRIPH